MISGSSKTSADVSTHGLMGLVVFLTALDPFSSAVRLLFADGDVRDLDSALFREALPPVLDVAVEDSLLVRRGAVVMLDFEVEVLASLPAREGGCGIDWQSSVARLTPADSRNDLALGLRTREGGGVGSVGGFCTDWTAKSTFARRFDALTGGERSRDGRLGVSMGLDLGKRIFFVGGSFGVSTSSGS
jgi:hypothetical protein